MRILILASFLIVLVLFLTTQMPVILTAEQVSQSVSDAIAELQVAVDEDEMERAVQLSVAKLEHAQRNRLKYLASAYFIIWLVFMLYVLRLARHYYVLDKRLVQLEQASAHDEK